MFELAGLTGRLPGAALTAASLPALTVAVLRGLAGAEVAAAIDDVEVAAAFLILEDEEEVAGLAGVAGRLLAAAAPVLVCDGIASGQFLVVQH